MLSTNASHSRKGVSLLDSLRGLNYPMMVVQEHGGVTVIPMRPLRQTREDLGRGQGESLPIDEVEGILEVDFQKALSELFNRAKLSRNK